jgi:hypothetical protein
MSHVASIGGKRPREFASPLFQNADFATINGPTRFEVALTSRCKRFRQNLARRDGAISAESNEFGDAQPTCPGSEPHDGIRKPFPAL